MKQITVTTKNLKQPGKQHHTGRHLDQMLGDGATSLHSTDSLHRGETGALIHRARTFSRCGRLFGLIFRRAENPEGKKYNLNSSFQRSKNSTKEISAW